MSLQKYQQRHNKTEETMLKKVIIVERKKKELNSNFQHCFRIHDTCLRGSRKRENNFLC